jgi:hypothetical protein
MHSIPHTQSPENNTPPQPIDSQEDSTVTPVTHRVNPNVTEGEGVSKNIQDEWNSDTETPPVTNWVQKG